MNWVISDSQDRAFSYIQERYFVNRCRYPKIPSTTAPTENHYRKVVEQAAVNNQ